MTRLLLLAVGLLGGCAPRVVYLFPCEAAKPMPCVSNQGKATECPTTALKKPEYTYDFEKWKSEHSAANNAMSHEEFRDPLDKVEAGR